MNKKTIKIAFVDFWPKFNIKNNFIINPLKKRYEVIIDEDNPDYVFYSVFSSHIVDYDGSDVIKIFYTGENVRPDFNLCDYAIGFDYIEYGDCYLRYPLWAKRYYDSNNGANVSLNNTKDIDLLNRDFCSFVYSNNVQIRRDLFDSISKYKKVASGGKALNNIGNKVGPSSNDKFEFINKYKFTIACENKITDGYTTEKIMDAYLSKTIPIYLGNKNVIRDFNKDSFINVNDFDNEDELLKYIEYLDNNDEEYLKMLHADPLTKQGKKYIQDNYLADFLYNIFDQDKKDAVRSKRRKIYNPYQHKYGLFNKKLSFKIYMKVTQFLSAIFKRNR